MLSQSIRLIGSTVLIATAMIATAADAATAADKPAPPLPVVTQHDVVPVLLRHCTVCHGRQRQEAELDLRSRLSMLTGGKSGPAIVLGKPGESLLIQKIRSGQMPPKENLLNTGTRPIGEGDINRLVQWIQLGAPEVAVAPDLADTSEDPLVSDKDRQFWAFQPPRQAPIPRQNPMPRQNPVPRPVELPNQVAVPEPSVENPIDAFILRGLQPSGRTFAPAAGELTLLRRATIDLTGLPPTPEEVQAYEEASTRDPSSAFRHLIDRLLDSPRYGERWGRYWLDAVGYADSWGGKLDADHQRPHAWRYRDYVIRSLNDDKPYDRFLLEQIAGDELVDYENADVITDEIYTNLVATGFLRMGPDSTSEREVSFVSDRVDVIADEMDIFSSTVLGLTMKCARCHNHKYDPLPQRDYYRLVAIFKGAYDEYDWLKPVLGSEKQYKFDTRLLPYITSAEREQLEEHNGILNDEIKSLEHDLSQKVEASKQKNGQEESQPTLEELKELDADFKKQAEEVENAIKELQAKILPEPGIQALWDRGEPSPTYIYQRGEPGVSGHLVQAGAPAVLTDGTTPLKIKPPWPGAKQTGRRLALARWVTRDDHPLTARVMVNRIWKHHFGTGIVKSVGNFGHTGSRPSHPELLDWLAVEFVKQGWSMKAMHRLMMTSRTYMQSSTIAGFGSPNAESFGLDSQFSSMPLQRMDAEVLRDTVLFVASRLDLTQFGRPDAVTVRPDGLVTSSENEKGWRRSVYVQQRRKEIPTILETFDLPQMNPNCLQRPESTVAQQALHLMNNAMIDQLADAFAQRVLNEVSDDLSRQVDRVHLIALSRPPDAEEKQIGMDALTRMTELWQAENQTNAPQRALATYCHTMLNSAAFLYID